MKLLFNNPYLAFLRFMLAWSRFDLAIARSTGRNPKDINAIKQDISRWELAVFREENRYVV